MNFFRTLRDSVYGPAFYSSIPSKSLGSSVWYLFKLSVLLSIIASLVFVPAIFSFFTYSTLEDFAAQYPEELVVTVTEGNVTTNVEEPYFIPDTDPEANVKNFVVIDTKSEFTLSQLEEYSTYLLVKKDFVVTNEKKGESRIIPFEEIDGFELSRPIIQGWIDALAPYLITGAIVISLIVVLGLAIGSMFTLIYLFFAALLAWLAAKTFKLAWSYKDSYKAALHAATLPMILSTIAMVAGFPLPLFSYTLLLALIVIVNLKMSPKTPVAVTPES